MKRSVTALLAVAGALLIPNVAPAAAQTSSCSGVNAVVLGTGAQVTQLRARGVSCDSARDMARQWLTGLSRRDAFVDCAPSVGAPAATCAIGRFSCRATGVAGNGSSDTIAITGNTMSCRSGRRSVAWRADFNMNAQPNWEEH